MVTVLITTSCSLVVILTGYECNNFNRIMFTWKWINGGAVNGEKVKFSN